MGIRDTRMMARALRERWPIEDRQRELMMRVLMQIAADASNSARERTQAIKAIISADAVNLKAQEIQQERQFAASLCTPIGTPCQSRFCFP